MRDIPRLTVSLVRETVSECVRGSKSAVAAFRALIPETDPREHFCALYLDGKNRPLGIHLVSLGTLNTSLVHPREVFAPAIACCAASVIIAHNHPSGDVAPSSQDCEVTRRLIKAAEILGINLLDHIIIGKGDDFYSFRQKGKILGF